MSCTSPKTIKDVKRRIRELGAFPAENQSELMKLCGAHPKAVGASGVIRN
jgi:hydrogenase maturation factor